MKRKLIISLFIGIVVATVFSALHINRSFYLWELRLSDTLFLPDETLPEIVIIGIDDASLLEYGRWPWDRSLHAQLIETLGDRPAVIGYDITFPEPGDEEEDQALRGSIEAAPSLVLPVEARDVTYTAEGMIAHTSLGSQTLFTEVARQGYVNTVADEDSITRMIPLQIRDQNGTIWSHFSLAVASEYSRVRNLPILDTASATTEDGLMRINYVGNPGSFRYYSFVDVVEGRVSPGVFDNAIVMVGAAAPNFSDAQITPVSYGVPMYGVEIHSNAVQTLLQEDYLLPENQWETILTIYVLSIGSALLLSMTGLVSGLILQAVIMILYIIYAFISFDLGVIRSIFIISFVILTVYIIEAVYKYSVEYRQRRFLRKAFSYYVSHEVLEEILRDPKQLKLGGQRRDMTVLFSDIKGFSKLSEPMTAEEVSQFLNSYLTRVSRRLFLHKAVIDKFVGDAVVAFWNAPIQDPDHVFHACSAAVAMREEVAMIKNDLSGNRTEHVGVRIGIASGLMVVGNMGSEMRFNYTVVGDNVNIGSRLENINKHYGTSIMITDTAYDKVSHRVVSRKIDDVVVLGRSAPMGIYELLDIGEPSPQQKRLITAYEDALMIYQRGDFSKAVQLFEDILHEYPHDGPAKTMRARAKHFLEYQPEDWDGVYHPTMK